MSNTSKIIIFLVDDDALFLKSLELEFLENADFEVYTFATGEECIVNLSKKPDLIILDYYLDGWNKNAMNGIDTLDKIKEINSKVPVVMLSSQDKIDIAISCMHHHAFDYVVKSETSFIRLKKIVTTIFQNQELEKHLNWYMERM